jgi:hypothetical protein
MEQREVIFGSLDIAFQASALGGECGEGGRLLINE